MTDCIGRAQHTKAAAREVAFGMSQNGYAKWSFYQCDECFLWHVERRGVQEVVSFGQ